MQNDDEDEDSDEVNALLEASGFVDLFASAPAAGEDLLSTVSLRRQLFEVRNAYAPPQLLDHASSVAMDVVLDDKAQPPALLRQYAPEPCKTLAITFGGLTQGVGGMPSHEFVKSLERVEAKHVLFVRDAKQAWYLHGIDASDASFEGIIHALQAECDQLRPERIVTIGASMGGYAAIRAGLALGSSTVLAFAPQVFLLPSVRRQLRLPSSSFVSPWAVEAHPAVPLLRSPLSARCAGAVAALK